MLGKLGNDEKAKWPEHLNEMCQAYNCTRSAITGYSPHFLMFGRRPRIPIDFFFPTTQHHYPPRMVPEYVVNLRERLQAAFSAARSQTTDEARRQKRLYDRKTSSVILHPGDIVLVRADAKTGRRKIMDRWEERQYAVLKRFADGSPVYQIVECGDSRNKKDMKRILAVASVAMKRVTLPVNANNPQTTL